MLSPGEKWSGLTETLHFQKMRCWDVFSRCLLKPQEKAFFNSNGCIKWTCSGEVGFKLLHLHLLAAGGGGGAQPAACTACRRLRPPLGARWSLRQADTARIKE